MLSFQICRSIGQKRQNWYDLAAYTSETVGVTVYGGSYVVNLFKQEVLSQENESSNVHSKLRQQGVSACGHAGIPLRFFSTQICFF